MKATAPLFGLFALATVAAGPARAAQQPFEFRQIDREFICPEKLPSDEARRTALKLFMDSVASARPSETMADAILFRRTLLKRHNCVETLQHIRDHEAAVAAGDVLHQAWLPIAPGLAVAVDYIKPYLDPRTTGERSVETYVRAKFPEPRVTNVTKVTYDTVVSRAVYYCRSRRYALIENDYFLSGKEALKDPTPPVSGVVASGPLYPLSARPPGSLNDTAAKWVCGVEAG